MMTTKEEKEKSKALDEVLLAGREIMECAGMPFVLVGGTLLGIIRNGYLLPWDDDVDVGVLAEDINEVNKKKVIEHPSFQIESACESEHCQLALFPTKSYRFDIFPLNKKSCKKCGFPVRYYNQAADQCLMWSAYLVEKKNWTQIEYLGLKWNAPGDPEEFCRQMYGDDWHIEQHEYDWHRAYNFRTLEQI